MKIKFGWGLDQLVMRARFEKGKTWSQRHPHQKIMFRLGRVLTQISSASDQLNLGSWEVENEQGCIVVLIADRLSVVLEFETVDFLGALVKHEQRRIVRQEADPVRPVTSQGYTLQVEHAFYLAIGDTNSDHSC